MYNDEGHWKPDKYKLALKLACLLTDQGITVKETEEVFELTSQILKIKYADSQPEEIAID